MNINNNLTKYKLLAPVTNEEIKKFGNIFINYLNDFLDGQELFANLTIYNIHSFNEFIMIKISFDKKKKEIFHSKESITEELKKINLEEKTKKKFNYKIGNDIYIIASNEYLYWSEKEAEKEAHELIIEILNKERQTNKNKCK